MEDKPSAGDNMMQGWAYGCLNLQASIQLQYDQKPCMSELPFAFSLVENERRESITIEDDDVANKGEEYKLEQNEAGKSEDGSPWHRTKWTGKMVKLLITILSYIGEDPSTDCSGSRIKVSSLLRKLGKWKCVSKVMVKRGYHVSPQQCEDKFNNLNKTYRRLNDLLGRGTSCKVVENPELLDILDVSEQNKEDVRKILTSKHLFFEEMCSYHNGNRLYLPHDPDLLRSLLFILKNEDDDGLLDSNQLVLDGTDQKASVFNEAYGSQEQRMVYRSYQLEKLKLELKSKVLDLEKQRLKWRCRSWKQDLELDKMRLRNKCLKLGNECIAMQLKQIEKNGS